MPRFTPAHLTSKALAAVEEAYREALKGPIHRTKALAFALAYLANVAEERAARGEEMPKASTVRAPFDAFWKEVARPLANNESLDFGRRQSLHNYCGVIFRSVGVEPVD